jgi:RimJ/RimL family protein N-acetyltransferase
MIEVREPRWDDFGSLTESYYDLYAEVKERPDLGILLFAEKPTLGQEAVWFGQLLREVEEGRRVAGVAVVDDRAVGLCEVHHRGPSPEIGHLGELGIVVARGHRDRGVGRALLKFVLDKCRGRFSVIVLSVFVRNESARHLYRSVGFRPWGILPRAVRRGPTYYDEEHMVLDLEPPTGG